MPNYGIAAGVFELYPKIGSVSVVTTNLVNNYLDRAESNIDMRISHLYATPVTCNPPSLKDMSETLALGMLLRRFYTQEKEAASEWVQSWFDYVNDNLMAVALGSATLVCSGGSAGLGKLEPTGLTLAPWSSTETFKPTFDHRNQIFQRIDPDLIEAEDERDEFGARQTEFC